MFDFAVQNQAWDLIYSFLRFIEFHVIQVVALNRDSVLNKNVRFACDI